MPTPSRMTWQSVGAIHESPAVSLVANSQDLQHIAIAIRRLYRTHSVYRACLASISPFVPASYFSDSPGYRTPLGVSATIGSTPQSGAGKPVPTVRCVNLVGAIHESPAVPTGSLRERDSLLNFARHSPQYHPYASQYHPYASQNSSVTPFSRFAPRLRASHA